MRGKMPSNGIKLANLSPTTRSIEPILLSACKQQNNNTQWQETGGGGGGQAPSDSHCQSFL